MLARDEANVLPATLRRVLPAIDAWTVVDTGSTDNTPEIAEELLNGKPGQVIHRPWKNFAHNRTELLALAREAETDYTLTLDADHVLHIEGDQPDLKADEYLLRIRGNMEWKLPLLTKTSHPFRYVGAAHAYLTSDQPATSADQQWLSIEGGPGPGRDKLERDRVALEEAHAEDPNDARTVFYLAQTYRDLDLHDQAADMYRRRVRMGGWDQEVFWACYQEGLIRARDRFEDGVPFLLEAYERRPSRCEPLHVLADGYHRMGDHTLARLFANVGSAIPLPGDSLFTLAWMYQPDAWSTYLPSMEVRAAA